MLEGKVCAVAGAGGGLGRAAAERLAAHGARVVVNDLGTSVHGEGADPAAAETTAATIRETGGDALAHHGDVASLVDAADLVATAVDAHGRLDSVANFAGILRDGWLTNLSADDWDAVVRANLRSHFAMLRAAARRWRSVGPEGLEAQRSFLGVSSRGWLGNPGQANYSASKAGVVGLVRSASTELYDQHVRVNALVPSGYTRMTATVPAAKRPYTSEEMPPERVAPMVAYLASDAATDVTGCTIYCGGDRIGIYADPELDRVAAREGGWTAEAIAEAFDGELADGIDLTRTERFL